MINKSVIIIVQKMHEGRKMMENANRKKWRYISMAFSLAVYLLCAMAISRVAVGYVYAEMQIYEVFLLLVGLFAAVSIAQILQTIIHEAGHLVFGFMSGYKFGSFRIFSFMWVKRNDKIKLCRLSIAGTAGQCLMAPPDMADGKIPVVLYNLGGSIMNFVVSGIALGVYFAISRSSIFCALLPVFALVGFAAAILNGVPMKTEYMNNDGYNALELTRSADVMRAFWVQMKVGEALKNGVRLKDMPEEWFVTPSDEDMKNGLIAAIGVLSCNRMMDERRFDEADALMKHMLEIDSGIVGSHRGLMICDRIFIELIGQNRRDVIDDMLDDAQKKFMKRMKSFISVIRTEYAYALLYENDKKRAEMLKDQFETWAKCYPYQADAASERELLAMADQRANQD